ncbi:MAG: hypothetical protein RR291_01620, partial [Clostridia bacterium]
MATIENERFLVKIEDKGATLSSIFDKQHQEELLWQPSLSNGKSWNNQDVVIFPLIGKLLDGYFVYKGKKFPFTSHGFARSSVFKSRQDDKSSVTHILTSNDETLKLYPFNFILSVTHTLNARGIELTFKTINTGDNTMYFMLGSHPAISIPAQELVDCSNILGNKLVFTQQNTIQKKLDKSGAYCIGESEVSLSSIELSKKLFVDNGTIILQNVVGDIVLEKSNGRRVIFRNFNSDFVAIWSEAPYGAFVCVEPWWGSNETLPINVEIEKKNYVKVLSPKQEYA